MLYTESKKRRLAEVLIKENNEDVLKKVEEILLASKVNSSSKLSNFSNKLTKEELDEFERNIEEGCEQINENDWK